MKKFLSVMLATVMVVSAIIAVCIVPTSAASKGDWSVYSIKDQYADDYTGIKSDIPGYEYVRGEGLKMIPAEWKDSNPYATFQTTEKVYLKEGVYLEVRIDQFSYDAADKWFGFSLWDEQNVSLGKQGEGYGFGVETLIRHVGVSVDKETGLPNEKPDKYDENDPSTWAGAMNGLEWYRDLEEGNRENCGTYNKDDYQYKFDEQGRPILVFEVKWDAGNEMCVAYINGVAAPANYNYGIKTQFEEAGWMAYVGFSLQNSKLGGTAGCTILKFGTSEADAKAPTGDDKQDPRPFSNEVAPLQDASNIPAGNPAIRLNGTVMGSNVAGKPNSYAGNIIVVNEDGSVNLTAAANGTAYIQFRVDNTVSYATEDFPIILFIMRNFCYCTYTDEDGDGVPEEECACSEQFGTLALAGDVIKEASSYGAKATTNMWNPVYTENGDSYTWFVTDWSTSTQPLSGRIHGLRMDFTGIKSDRNNFDICEIAFFRDAKEAEAYFNAYMEELTGGEITDNPGNSGGNEDESDVQTPGGNEGETSKPGNDNKPSTPDNNKPGTSETEPSGDDAATSSCLGVVGVGTIAVVAIVAAGLVSFKKKED